jgi:hypothetical protein
VYRCSDVIGDLPATGPPIAPTAVVSPSQPASTSPLLIAPGMAGWSQWTRRRSHHTGHAAALARFLQHLFRGYCRLCPSGWGHRGGLPMPYRPVTTCRCRGGLYLAPSQRFEEMRQKSSEVITWYNSYVDMYRRLSDGLPSIILCRR